MIRINNIKMPVCHDMDMLKKKTAKILGVNPKEVDSKTFKISGKSLDARNKENIQYIYSVELSMANEKRFIKIKNVKEVEPFQYYVRRFSNPLALRPVVVGSGPAGLFATLILAEYGLCPIILERGKRVEERQKDVDHFWHTGILNPESNVQFGEGGAGTFSDGKLTTNTHDIRIKKVIEEFIKAGADEEISYIQKPHLGTDQLIRIMQCMRARIESLGGEYRFQNKLISIKHQNNELKSVLVENKDGCYEIETDGLILAIGHSARDTVEMLSQKGLKMEQKPFAIGVRIEHEQKMINVSQYGKYADELPAADYKLNVRLLNGRGVYTFCMCPGGRVVAAASEPRRLAINGMSYYGRDLPNANAALLVSVDPQDFGSQDSLAGIELQRRIEASAYELGGGGYKAPVQLCGDFIKGQKSVEIGNVLPSYAPGYCLEELKNCMPLFISEALKAGLVEMDKKIKGFAKYDSVLTAVESRSSSPVRITRGEDLFSNIKGIMPCGEGAGYAGGIMSAAVDGIRCAEELCQFYKNRG